VPETPVVDLMEALKRSVAEAQERKTPKAGKPRGGGRTRAAAGSRKSA